MLTSCRTPAVAPWRSGAGSAIDSSEASDTSLAVGYRNDTWSNSISGARAPAAGAGSTIASGRSAISGFRSSISKTRSKLTSAVITLIWTLDSCAIGP